MNYRIEYLEEVFDQLAKIPKNVRQTIIRAINERLGVNPCRFRPLVDNFGGFFRMRVGDYRVIYRVKHEKVTVLIVKIDVRGNVYK
ncbi:MAG: type II toxin-antitoxin system RelE/ParE family toxin [Holosporaceae bacterium]|jgi:mRNA interferase RelE/StbE|nr:type II toxin-antitoxin system RelE/ParE family toxin [Holosporaceae bacterium]